MQCKEVRWLTDTCLNLCLAFCLLANTATAESVSQADKISELTAMETADQDSINRLKTLANDPDQEVALRASLRLARLYWQSNQLEAAEAIINGQLEGLTALNSEQQIRVLMQYAEFENHKNNYSLAQEIIEQQALPLAQPDSILLGQVYHKLGRFLRHQLKLSEAKPYLDKAVEEYIRIDDQVSLAQAYGSIGIVLINMGRVAEALDYQQRARAIYEVFGNKADMASNYYNIGELYERTGDLDNALDYYQRTLVLDKELNNASDIAFDHYAIASIHLKRGNFTDALAHNLQSVDLFDRQEAHQLLSRSYLQQAGIYAQLNDQDARLKSLRYAETAGEQSGTRLQTQGVNLSFGRYYFETENYEAARKRLETALEAANALNAPIFQYDDNFLLSQVHEKLGNVQLAYKHLSDAFHLKQQMNDETQIREAEKYKRDINLLEEQLKVEQLEVERAEQARVIEIQRLSNLRNTLLFAFSVIFLIGLGYLLWQRRRLALLKAKLIQDTLEQKDRMFADVSHELRTPLTSLKLQVDALQRNLIKDVDASYEKISLKVMDINQLITQIHDLAQSDTGLLILEKARCDLTDCFELWDKEFRDFVEGQGLVYQSQISLHTTKAEFDLQRVRQVLFNLLSNSCLYTDKPGTVSVSVSSDHENLTVQIEDSAPSVAEDEHKKIFQRLYRVEKSRSRKTGGSGLGLAICKSLIEAHDGRIYAQKSELGGLCVVVALAIRV